jgi:5-methylcytosine-specific restriction enzyme A
MPYGHRSARTQPLPDNWDTEIRPRILARDNQSCQWPASNGSGQTCGQAAPNVDHKTPVHLGGTDNDDNLWCLCNPHERAKTAAEGGRAAQARRIPRQRPTEPHPGLIA